MFLQTLRKRPVAVAGMLAIGAAVAVSNFGVARADHANKNCNKSNVCGYFQNSGPALEGVTTNANTRALYIYATSPGADGTDINGGYIGIIGRAPAGGSSALFPLVLTDQNGNDLDFTDTNGNIFYHGSLIQFLRTRHGQIAASYAPQSTAKTIEDVGSARLVNGQATIALDRTFADSIDLQAAYHVFLTPNGDTRGLFVAQKSPTSFVVRETQGGRGTLNFDYRVVGSALGHAGERMDNTRIPQPYAPVKR